MIQRTILRSSAATQSLQRCLLPQSSSSAVATRRQTTPLYQRRRLHQHMALRPRPMPPFFLHSSRQYSEAAAQPKPSESEQEKKNASTAGTEEGGEVSAEEKAKKEMEAKNKEIAELKDKYLRSVADFRNLQERTKREVQAAKDFALQRFARDFIDSVDNFDRALDSVPADKLSKLSSSGAGATEPNADLVALHAGLKMADGLLHSTLRKHGLERFDPLGQKFDPKVHDATFMAPQPDKEDGMVFHVQQKGFMLNGRVLRAAKVGVVKNS